MRCQHGGGSRGQRVRAPVRVKRVLRPESTALAALESPQEISACSPAPTPANTAQDGLESRGWIRARAERPGDQLPAGPAPSLASWDPPS